MAHGGPTVDPRVAADLRTVRVWQRCLAACKVTWPLSEATWDGSQRAWPGPPQHVHDGGQACLGSPRSCQSGWREGEQHFTCLTLTTGSSGILSCILVKLWLTLDMTFKFLKPALRRKLCVSSNWMGRVRKTMSERRLMAALSGVWQA
eukprot:2505609-Amphidinium_carterae.1